MLSNGTVVEEAEEAMWRQIVYNRTVLVNMICMAFVWTSASFNYYLISFQLKYIQGSIWTNGIISSTSEGVAYALSGILLEKLGLKFILICSYVVAILGMGGLVIFQPPGDQQLLLSLLILGSKFGVSACFNLAYVGNQFLFPISIVATSYGICNVFSRFATIAAPGIAEIKPESISEWVFVSVCVLAFVASLNLRPPPKDPKVNADVKELLLEGQDKE